MESEDYDQRNGEQKAIDSDPVDKDEESEKGCHKYRRSGATS
jgi:hypothetical protein